MYPKHFFENYWASEQKNQLFVCMPFDGSFDEKFSKITRVACELGFECAKTVKEGLVGGDLLQEILDGIGNSRTLLFDLSDDHESNNSNHNVVYELGIATAIREPDDMLLIKKKSEKKIPFDVSHLRYNEYDGNLEEKWLVDKLDKIVKNQEWSKSRRIASIARAIDSSGHTLLVNIYAIVGLDNFHDASIGRLMDAKLAILRLMDLGILRFEVSQERSKREWSYYWTPFGKEVMKYLGIEKPNNI